jgi:hypothetical protein
MKKKVSLAAATRKKRASQKQQPARQCKKKDTPLPNLRCSPRLAGLNSSSNNNKVILSLF